MVSICGVYRITNLINGKFYIGSSANIGQRWEQHLYRLRNNKHENPYLQKAWNKYGESNFQFEVIEECNSSDQYQREQHYLDLYQPFGEQGYNIVRNISKDLMGGILFTKVCEVCGREYSAFSHLSKYCSLCKEEIAERNAQIYKE